MSLINFREIYSEKSFRDLVGHLVGRLRPRRFFVLRNIRTKLERRCPGVAGAPPGSRVPYRRRDDPGRELRAMPALFLPFQERVKLG